jgi:hypothetical protein
VTIEVTLQSVTKSPKGGRYIAVLILNTLEVVGPVHYAHCTVDCVDPRSCLGGFGEKKFTCHHRGSNSEQSNLQQIPIQTNAFLTSCDKYREHTNALRTHTARQGTRYVELPLSA